jgi:Mn-dependent DtxR family transcriptional regulator
VAKRAVRFLNRQDGSVSRAGLSAALGITAAQCSEVVSYLADSGMIGEAADGIRLSAFAADALRVFDLA